MNLEAAMRLAIEQADRVKGTTYPNPPVGAVILDRHGEVVGLGATQPPGGPHAEVVALHRAAERAAGGAAFVTLEPCNHYGRTPPCVDALLSSGVSTVTYAVADPNPVAAGGADRLAEAGVKVTAGLLADAAAGGPLREWLHKQRFGLPHVTWTFTASVDGRRVAHDESGHWATSEAARADMHRRRGAAEAVMVDTGTAMSDGLRTMLIGSQDPLEVIKALSDRTDVLLEGGPTLAGAFLQAGVVDRILAYVPPILLGRRVTTVDDVDVLSMVDAQRWRYDGVEPIGPDLLLSLVPA